MSNQQSHANLTPLQHLQERFAIIDLSGAIRVVDHYQVQRIRNGALKSDVALWGVPFVP